MRYKKFGKSDMNVSVIGLGTWAMGGAVQGSNSWGALNDSEAISAIRKAVDCGVNLIDTAPVYGIGHAEELVGKAIKGIREKVILVTKCGPVKKDGKIYRDLRPEAIRNQLEASLSRLGVDALDIFLIHWPDPNTPLEDSLGELVRLKQEGKFRYLGVSNFDRELLKKAVSIADISWDQPEYSILARQNEEIISFCKDKGIGVMTYGSLGAGILSGKYSKLPDFAANDVRETFYHKFFSEPAFGKTMELVDVLRSIADGHGKPVSHVAINWVTQQEGVSTALVGAKTVMQAEENALAGSWELSEEELAEINRAYGRIFAGN